MKQDRQLQINYNSNEDTFFDFPSQFQIDLSLQQTSILINPSYEPNLFQPNRDEDFESAFKKNFPFSNPIINLEEEEEYESNLYFIKKEKAMNIDDINSMPLFRKRNLEQKEDNEPYLYSEKIEKAINADDIKSMPLFIKRILEQKEDIRLPEYFKLEACVKHWKVAVNQYISWKIDHAIEKFMGFNSTFSSNKPFFKIPESMTKNCNYVDNFDWLSEKIKNLGKINSKLKRKIAKIPLEDTKEINKIMELIWEEAIKLFYNDEKIFEIFKSSKLTQYYEEGLKQYKIRSFVENYGFLQYIKFESSPREKCNQEKLAQKRQRIK